MTFLSGKKLDSGNSVKKNQKIEKDTNLYFKKMRFAKRRMAVKNKNPNKTGNSKMLFEIE